MTFRFDPSVIPKIIDVVVAGFDVTSDDLDVWCSLVMVVFTIVINLKFSERVYYDTISIKIFSFIYD